MASRSLTDIFILMRNNAIQSRNFYSDQVCNRPYNVYSSLSQLCRCFLALQMSNSDTASLVYHEDDAMKSRSMQVRMPPDWTDNLEEAQYILSKIQTRLKELGTLQNKHLLKPTFDDSLDEEKQIDSLTQEITKVN